MTNTQHAAVLYKKIIKMLWRYVGRQDEDIGGDKRIIPIKKLIASLLTSDCDATEAEIIENREMDTSYDLDFRPTHHIKKFRINTNAEDNPLAGLPCKLVSRCTPGQSGYNGLAICVLEDALAKYSQAAVDKIWTKEKLREWFIYQGMVVDPYFEIEVNIEAELEPIAKEEEL